MENVEDLRCGMKDRYAYLVPIIGHTECFQGGRVQTHGPGTLRLIEPGELYRELRHDGPATFELVLLDTALFDEACLLTARRAGPLASPVLACTDERVQPLLRLHAQLRRPAPALQRQAALVAALTALVELLWGRAPLPRQTERPAVRRARHYLLDQLSHHVTLDELADAVELDKYHLIRAFHAEVGVPPYEFLTQARILRARQLLRSGMSAAAVAVAVGYCDQSQMHRHFRRIVGRTPGQFARGQAV
jgi:AraC-like DNA-binding protein